MSNKSSTYEIKCVVVGDGAVGKTCLLITYTSEKFPQDYIPTLFDNFHRIIKLEDNQSVRLSLYDTAGQEDYDQMRPLSYPETNVFVVCYSCVSRTSFENVKHKWCPEVRTHVPDALIVLCGTKMDMRTDAPEKVTLEEGKQLMEEVGAAAHVECSAKTLQGVKDVFTKAVDVVIADMKAKHAGNKPNKKCIMC